MNAASRDINQFNFFHGQLVDMHVPRPMFLQMMLLFVVFLSALAVVYVTNLHRNTLSALEQEQQYAHQLDLEYGQLLLENASLVSPAHVEELANEKLNMVLPISKETFVLRAQ
jgi:cell division protein FtsL